MGRPATGSSPLVRGTGGFFSEGITRLRFIPARAGNRRRPWCLSGSRSVHPRSCGEQNSRKVFVVNKFGSSPLVRGTAARGFLALRSLRFIPARAGNSCGARRCRRAFPVHPRSCGEQPTIPASRTAMAGSSPLVRGTGLRGPGLIQDRRFIPARAGNRCSSPSRFASQKVHPRSCGEQPQAEQLHRTVAGSSPLVRGTAKGYDMADQSTRFIPARAGNRKSAPARATRRAVHPRSCGEQGWGVWDGSRYSGSSPLVRGTDFRVCQ